jgi:nucleotide-binding universal stress UspA family protein
MTPTIVIEFDDPMRGRDALALARSLGAATGARFVTVSSYRRDRYGMLPVNGWHWAAPDETRAAAELSRSLTADDPGAVTRMVGATSQARALHETAEREQADLIVLSSSIGTQLGQVGTGDHGRQALQGAPCAVAVAPAGYAGTDGELAPVGAGFDGSLESRQALASAAGLAEAIGGEMCVISVLERPLVDRPMSALAFDHEHLDELADEGRSRLLNAVDALPVQPDMDALVLDGEPHAVLTAQSDDLGLLVLGSRGYGPLRRVLLGSVSDAVLNGARCPVMIVPRGLGHHYGAATFHARPAHSH